MPVGISTGVSYLRNCRIRFYHLGPFQKHYLSFICQNNDGGFQDSDDDWETDPDHINVMSEEQQRYLLIFIRKRGRRKIFLGGEVLGTREPWIWTSSGEERSFRGFWELGGF